MNKSGAYTAAYKLGRRKAKKPERLGGGGSGGKKVAFADAPVTAPVVAA